MEAKWIILILLTMLLSSTVAAAQLGEPNIVVTSVVTLPESVEVGESITIAATVTNIGTVEGTASITFSIAGEVKYAEDVTLWPLATKIVSCEIIMDKEGEYTVHVDGKTATFSVTKAELIKALLQVDAPLTADVGEEITATVTSDGVHIEGATVLVDNVSIGTTDINGQVNHTFDSKGAYLITAEKDGYIPAIGATLIVTEVVIKDIVPPIIILKELYPKYFVVGDDEAYKVQATVIDNTAIKKISLFYRVDDGEWKEVEMRFESEAPSEIIDIVLAEIPHVVTGVYASEIQSQKAGVFVDYKVKAEDKANNSMESTLGMYFVCDDEAAKVMVVDPSMKLWFYKENALHFKKQAEQYSNYHIPEKIWVEYIKLGDRSKEYSKYIIPRHWWEMVAEKYNIKVVDHEELTYALNFKPSVIILSNIWLDQWDLADNGMKDLIRYVRENNAGLIATHGTLFDGLIWMTPPERDGAIEVGPRGQIGDKLEVYTMYMEKETVSMALGFPLMPLAEFIRDQIAEIAGSVLMPVDGGATGIAIGSVPLAVPYVPFDGNLIVEERHPVVEGLPDKFKIKIPSFYDELRIEEIDAYTLVGWQYILPSDIRKETQDRAQIAKGRAETYYEKISEYQSQVTGVSIPKEHLLKGLDGKEFNAITEMKIDPELKATITLDGREYTIQLDRGALEEITKRAPIKTIVLSEDFLGGILVYDEWFRPDGHRSVYFSFELEAARDETSKKLLINSIEWTKGFEFKLLEELEKVSRETLEAPEGFRELTTEYLPLVEISKTLSEIKPEKPLAVEIEKGDVQSIEIKVKKVIRDANISIERIPRKPTHIGVTPPGNIYGYLEISAEDIVQKNVDKVTIQFKVKKSWVAENNIDVNTIKLNRYSGGEWNALATEKIDEDEVYVYFEAESPGLSTFAITGKKEVEERPPLEEKVPTPGFELIFAIAGLLAAIYLIFQKRE